MIQILFTKGFEKNKRKICFTRGFEETKKKNILLGRNEQKNILLGLFVKDFTK